MKKICTYLLHSLCVVEVVQRRDRAVHIGFRIMYLCSCPEGLQGMNTIYVSRSFIVYFWKMFTLITLLFNVYADFPSNILTLDTQCLSPAYSAFVVVVVLCSYIIGIFIFICSAFGLVCVSTCLSTWFFVCVHMIKEKGRKENN